MSAVSQLKAVARAVAPTPVRAVWGRVYGGVKVRRARRAFETAAADSGRPLLPMSVLERLMAASYVPPDRVRYDPEGLVILQGESPQMISGADAVDWDGDGTIDLLTGQGHGASGLRFYARDWLEDERRHTHPVVTIQRIESKP